MSHFGKYRGTVTNNIDPMMQGRVQVSVPTVLGQGRFSWAMPNAPYAGDGVGFFAIPPIGANVWVEFEGGDVDYPIWAGCFWGPNEIPVKGALPTTKVFKTDSVTLKLDDLPGVGGLVIEVGPPVSAINARIAVTGSGIEITYGGASVELSTVSVSMNKGALEVL